MKKFEIGKEYFTRSICDSECIFSIKITGRTAPAPASSPGVVNPVESPFAVAARISTPTKATGRSPQTRRTSAATATKPATV